ncbi:hypothetical protein vseg_016044 [Gypsophila vaccaria]
MANSSENSNAVNQQDESMLAKHVRFFDRNNDGVIYPWETFEGFRAIGFGVILSALAAIGINVGLSGTTRPGKFPSILFPIEIQNIALTKHGSDTGVIDRDGRFVQEKFDEIFSKHAHLNKNALTFLEVQFMLNANRNDLIGGIAAFFEWNLLYFIGKDEQGYLQKDTIMGLYDGTLFDQIAQKQAAKKSKQG